MLILGVTPESVPNDVGLCQARKRERTKNVEITRDLTGGRLVPGHMDPLLPNPLTSLGLENLPLLSKPLLVIQPWEDQPARVVNLLHMTGKS